MPSQKPIPRLTAQAMRRYIGLAALYILLVFLLPASKQAMHDYSLSPLEYHLLLFAIVLPSLVVWFAAFYGYTKLQEYANLIKGTPESPAFQRLASGCAWLAWSLPLPAILSLILNAITNTEPNFKPASIIIINYVNLLFPLVAFSIIGIASRGLLSQAKIHLSVASARGIMLLFVAAGVLYCYLTFRHFDSANLTSTGNPYYLPIWLMVVTVIIPYLYAWFIGLLAAYEITSFSKQVKGLLYRQALHLLVGGLVAVIAGSIALQYVSSISPPTGHLLLNYRLAFVTVFRIIGGVGFIMIALGASRLKKIEEV